MKQRKTKSEMLANAKSMSEKRRIEIQVPDEVCRECGHSLKDNNHGPDQNDYSYDAENDRIIFRGSCTYCKVCQGA